jgi:hypothetical protein
MKSGIRQPHPGTTGAAAEAVARAGTMTQRGVDTTSTQGGRSTDQADHTTALHRFWRGQDSRHGTRVVRRGLILSSRIHTHIRAEDTGGQQVAVLIIYRGTGNANTEGAGQRGLTISNRNGWYSELWQGFSLPCTAIRVVDTVNCGRASLCPTTAIRVIGTVNCGRASLCPTTAVRVIGTVSCGRASLCPALGRTTERMR